MRFSRQEYWSGLPFLSPEDLPDPGTEVVSPALQADSLRSEPTREAVSPFLGDLISIDALLQTLFPWPVEQLLRHSEISLGFLYKGLHYDPHLQGFPLFKDGSCFSEEPPLPRAMGGGRPPPPSGCTPHPLPETLLGQLSPPLFQFLLWQEAGRFASGCIRWCQNVEENKVSSPGTHRLTTAGLGETWKEEHLSRL